MSSIIIVQGYLAAGKSTFARELARELSIPCFVKDTFKIALCQSVQIDSREVSSRFSAVTFDGMVYAAERLMEAGVPLILEGNFLPAGIKKTDEATPPITPTALKMRISMPLLVWLGSS